MAASTAAQRLGSRAPTGLEYDRACRSAREAVGRAVAARRCPSRRSANGSHPACRRRPSNHTLASAAGARAQRARAAASATSGGCACRRSRPCRDGRVPATGAGAVRLGLDLDHAALGHGALGVPIRAVTGGCAPKASRCARAKASKSRRGRWRTCACARRRRPGRRAPRWRRRCARWRPDGLRVGVAGGLALGVQAEGAGDEDAVADADGAAEADGGPRTRVPVEWR